MNEFNSNPELCKAIRTELFGLGVPEHLKGYEYLVESIAIAVHDHTALRKITQCIYPEVAQDYETTPASVERALRTAIEATFGNGENIAVLSTYFGKAYNACKAKVTNKAFVTRVANKIRTDGTPSEAASGVKSDT